MFAIIWDRKARHLDRVGDAFRIDLRRGLEPGTHGNLRSIDMVGCQGRVRSPTLKCHCCSGFVDNEAVTFIAWANASHIANIVPEKSQDEMHPVCRLDRLP